MSAARLPDWPARLGAVVQQRLRQPLAWGGNDCVSFPSDCVLAMTGVDVLAALRLPRSTARQAQQQWRAVGRTLALQRAGLQRVDPRLAQRGDLVLLRQQPRRVLAVCLGEDAVSPGPQGLQHAAMSRAVMAWRV